MTDDQKGCLLITAIAIVIVVIAVWLFPAPPRPVRPPPKPLKFPSSEQVGEAVGKTTAGLGKGFVKGVYTKLKPWKSTEKASIASEKDSK